MFAEVLFWTSLITILLTFIIYPLLIPFIAYLIGVKQRNMLKLNNWPTVSLVISVYNEANVINEKIQNSLELDYPSDKYNVVVVSDSSNDDTEALVRGFNDKRVVLFCVKGRKGKTNALNAIIPSLESEIIVFSDANSIYSSDALTNIVLPFIDESVGGVCGELKYGINGDLNAPKKSMENFYWKYEKWIKRNESNINGVIVFNGSIYAIRRELHKIMNIEAANDFQHPIQIILQGYKNVYEPAAVAYEDMNTNDWSEYKRHVRITLRGWKGLFTYPQIINPFKVGFISIHFLLRKVLRWLSPIFLIILFTTNLLLLDNITYKIVFVAQVMFYLLAMIGLVFSLARVKTILNPIYYFCLTNIALFIALLKFCINSNSSTWTPTSHLK
jgi:cellulose synthase/poly-beta-1,6-N-acetylglucosamine synthase-like glycosyltransferase